MKGLSVVFMIFLSSCGTSPTPYQEEKNGEGFSDSMRDDLRISTFKANQYTKPEEARLYAEFRAIRNCHKDGYKFANVLDILDKTVSKDVTRTDSTGPMYYGSYGMYPFYSRYSGFGMGVGFGTASSRSWKETQVFPRIEVPYTCSNSIRRPEIVFREISPDEMKHLVKDLKGAIQVQNILENSPNREIKVGDIILRGNGMRIERVHEFIRLFDEKRPTVRVEVLRDGVKRSLSVKSKDVSAEATKQAQRIISDACKQKSVAQEYEKTLCKK